MPAGRQTNVTAPVPDPVASPTERTNRWRACPRQTAWPGQGRGRSLTDKASGGGKSGQRSPETTRADSAAQQMQEGLPGTPHEAGPQGGGAGISLRFARRHLSPGRGRWGDAGPALAALGSSTRPRRALMRRAAPLIRQSKNGGIFGHDYRDVGLFLSEGRRRGPSRVEAGMRTLAREARTGHAQRRYLRLPAWFMVWFVIALGLFCRDSYRQVFKWLQPFRRQGIPGRLTFCEARQRLGVAPLLPLAQQVVQLRATRSPDICHSATSFDTPRSSRQVAGSHAAAPWLGAVLVSVLEPVGVVEASAWSTTAAPLGAGSHRCGWGGRLCHCRWITSTMKRAMARACRQRSGRGWSRR
jgi:hypothetical protein